MDDRELEIKARAYVLAKELKKVHHQKNVYLGVLQHLKNSGVPDVDELIEDARRSPEIRAMTEAAYAFLDQWLPPIPEVDQKKVTQEWLEHWQSDGKEPN